jgi:intracellular sulfur oxidation DsrE/DsrF family protein
LTPLGPLFAYAGSGYFFRLEAHLSIPDSETAILVTRNGMGQADPALQLKLITTYLKLLDEHNILPVGICFYTEGVKLAVTGSPVLEQLRSLQAKGVHLILCSTCLNYYNLSDQVQVGIVGGMTDILEMQRRAAKVITI